MNIKYWFLIGAIAIGAYVGFKMDWQADVATTHLQQEKMRKQPPRLTDSLPTAAPQGAPSMGFVSRLKPDTSEPLPEIAEDVTERKELTFSGVTIDDPEILDPEEVENRILAEQLAESLRNPAYLQSLGEEPSEYAESDSAEDAEADASEEVDAEMLDADELADEQSEQAPEEEIALNDEGVDESAVESDQSFTHPQLTESGVEISNHGFLDPEEVEKRLLAEQLAESLRNPAYLQSNPEEEIIEETSEED